MKPITIMLTGALWLGLASGAAGQRGAKAIVLSPPNVRVSTTPLTVTLAWSPVAGAESYTVEQSTTSANGPWAALPLARPTFTQITAPSAGGPASNGNGGILYYYRVSALAAVGEPGVTVVSRVTPPLNAPMGVSARQDGTDLWVSWAPVPDAVGYLITAAPGPQSAPTHSVNADTQGAEIRLVNVVAPTAMTTVWVGVAARYGNGTALSPVSVAKVTFPAVQSCWPPGSTPGPAPVASVIPVGPTAVSITTAALTAASGSVARAERALLGTQAWLAVGCGYGPFIDQNLAAGTAYQYRITEISQAGAAGQSVLTVATPPAPESPTPTATLGSCVVGGCSVLLNWSHVPGAEGYRIETSVGFLYQNATASYGLVGSMAAGTPVSASFPFMPSGTHQFYLTPLFPPLRPGPQRPGLVTVVVP